MLHFRQRHTPILLFTISILLGLIFSSWTWFLASYWFLMLTFFALGGMEVKHSPKPQENIDVPLVPLVHTVPFSNVIEFPAPRTPEERQAILSALKFHDQLYK